MFMPQSDLRQQYAWFEEHLGPTVTGDLTLSFAPLTDEDDPLQRLELVKRAHLTAHRLENVHGVLSAMSFVPAVPTRRTISATATRGVIRQLIRDPHSSLGKLAFIHRDEDAEVWRISVRMSQHEETDLRKEIRVVRTAVEDELADSQIPVRVSFTGSVAIVQTAQQVLLHDLFRSFLSAFGIVAIVMMVLLAQRRWRPDCNDSQPVSDRRVIRIDGTVAFPARYRLGDDRKRCLGDRSR